jgi:dipeptidyl aminopeptidase/acylaminoacyl peptidase
MTVTPAAGGSWRSPLSARRIAGDTVSFGHVAFDHDDLYWSESRPREGGRQTVMRRREGRAEEILPAPWSARSRVHEYGGGAFAVFDGVVYFCHHPDQRVYAFRAGETPRPLTPEGPRRYADLRVDAGRRRLIAVSEMTGGEGGPRASVVAIPLAGGEPVTLIEGEDFYASPVLSADGARLAWLSWNHPAMPWDGARLWLAGIDGQGRPRDARLVAGGETESVFQPRFGAGGELYFASDRDGWWNLYRRRDGGAEPLCPRAAEFGLPQWQFGMSTYAVADRELVCAFSEHGQWALWRVRPGQQGGEPIPLPFTEITALRARGRTAAFLAASPAQAQSLVELDLDSGRYRVLRESAPSLLAAEDISVAEPVSFPTTGDASAHGFFYPPRNRDYALPGTGRPPLLVLAHGGPTAATGSGLNPRLQYFTTRGFAVLDVNYRGSTGYGRAYRQALDGQWGIADVEDCVAGARWLAAQGRVDGKRMVMRGSSAGGFTTLCALTFHDCFAAGASYYGIGDLETLATGTHKFEQHYLDRLVGPWPAAAARYRARSPIHQADRLRTPVIFFQGREDKVVPPDQAERLAAVLRARKIPVAQVVFDDEAHGFRRAANIERALEAEYAFYARVLGFAPADELPPLAIENLPPPA